MEKILANNNLAAYINSSGHIIVENSDLLNLLKATKDSFSSIILNDLFAADFIYREKRFEVIYTLLSLQANKRFIIKTYLNDCEEVASVTSLFINATWYEREIFDMFGITFSGLADCRRILTDYNFVGHPLRKDFPLSGHVQVTYDEELKKVVYEPVNLEQEFRSFNFISPWHNSDKLPGDEKASK